MVVALLLGCDRQGTTDRNKPVTLPDPLPIEITGSDFEWQIRYPGADGCLGNADDILEYRHPHVPEHTRVRISLKSTDYVYTFAIPRWDVREIAVPDLEYDVLLQTGPVETLELRGDQFCGFAHSRLSGEFRVESRAMFLARMTR